MSVQPAPDAVLELLACTCPKQCTTEECACLKNGLKCTDMFKLETCDNLPPSDDSVDPTEGILDEDDDNDDNVDI